MPNSKVSMPFAPPAPTTRDQIIAEGAVRLREQHKANVEAHRAAFEARAESEWLRAEAKRKSDFIEKFRYDHYVRPSYPYADLSPAGQCRVLTRIYSPRTSKK